MAQKHEIGTKLQLIAQNSSVFGPLSFHSIVTCARQNWHNICGDLKRIAPQKTTIRAKSTLERHRQRHSRGSASALTDGRLVTSPPQHMSLQQVKGTADGRERSQKGPPGHFTSSRTFANISGSSLSPSHRRGWTRLLSRSTETLHTFPPFRFCSFCVGWRFFNGTKTRRDTLVIVFSLAEGLQREKPVLRLLGLEKNKRAVVICDAATCGSDAESSRPARMISVRF